ncbi:LPLT2-like protein, partial [Mya arenaria]
QITQAPTGPQTISTTTPKTSTTTLTITTLATASATASMTTSTTTLTTTSSYTASATTSMTTSTTTATPKADCQIFHSMSSDTGRDFNGLQYTNYTVVDLRNCSIAYPLVFTDFDAAFRTYFADIIDLNQSSIRLYVRKEIPIGQYTNVTLMAKDPYNKTEVIAIAIRAKSVNDPPMFVGLQSTFDVAENTVVGRIVYSVTVLDPDIGDAGNITISTNSSFLTATKVNGSFLSILWSHHLALNKALDADTFQRNTSSIDVDDNAAVCQPEVTFYLPSSTYRKEYIVGDLNTHCVDRDFTPANRDIIFIVVKGNCTGYCTVLRNCSASGVYEEPRYFCTADDIVFIYQQILHGGNISTILKNLSTATSATEKSTGLFVGDIETSGQILDGIIKRINTSVSPNMTDLYVEIASNLMDESNIRSWKTIINKNGTGAETIMTKVDMYLAKLVKTVKLGQTSNCSVIQFPDADFRPRWDTDHHGSIQARCNQADGDVPYSATIYRNVSNIASVNHSSTAEQAINAPILGLSVYTNDERLMQQQVNISFQIFNKSLGNPQCSFLDTSKYQWATDGCRLIEHIESEGMVHCQCDHLTNFAILMSPSTVSSAPTPEVIKQDHALRVFTIVGCSFSIVGLVLTIIVYAIFWRTVKSGRSIHLIVLCCTFLFTYILFLSGVDKTSNKDMCTAIAVFLHYSILVVFFLMLAEGVTIALLVLRPLKKQELDSTSHRQCIDGSDTVKRIWQRILVNAVLLCIVVKFGVCGITAMARKSEIEKIKYALLI